MKVWILNHYAVVPDLPGPTRHFDFGSELVRRGHSVRVFASAFNNHTLRDEKLEPGRRHRHENIAGVDFVWIRTARHAQNDWRRVVNMLSYTLRVVLLGVRLGEKPDVILASSPHLLAGLAGWLLARLKKAQFVLEIRDLWPEALVEIAGYHRRSPVVLFLRSVEKFLYGRASRIITVIPNAAEYVVSMGVRADRIVQIPHGVNPAPSVDREYDLPEATEGVIADLKQGGKLIVCYTGLHGSANDLDSLIGAARIVQDREAANVHFLLVGDGTERARLRERSAGLGLNNVSFCEPVPKRAIPSLLSLVDIAVKPTLRSGLAKYGNLPSKTFDYMLAAVPIVWAAGSLVNDPVAEAHCGISVAPQCPEEMADAVIRLAGLSDSERREMGRRGRDFVMMHHTVPVLASRLLEAIGDGQQPRARSANH